MQESNTRPNFVADELKKSLSDCAMSDIMTRARAEKMRQIADMKARQHDMDLRIAEHVEKHPEAVTAAKNYVQRFLASERHKRFHWVLEQWRVLLETKTPRELANILRDTSDATEELRSSPPFCGIEFDN